MDISVKVRGYVTAFTKTDIHPRVLCTFEVLLVYIVYTNSGFPLLSEYEDLSKIPKKGNERWWPW